MTVTHRRKLPAPVTVGVPWGRATLSGSNQGTLPPEFRAVSAVSMALFVGAAAVVLGRVGLWGGDRFLGAFRIAAWALVAILPLGALMNLASSSLWERFGWRPLIAWLP